MNGVVNYWAIAPVNYWVDEHTLFDLRPLGAGVREGRVSAREA
jgi:hypothetical protein